MTISVLGQRWTEGECMGFIPQFFNEIPWTPWTDRCVGPHASFPSPPWLHLVLCDIGRSVLSFRLVLVPHLVIMWGVKQ